jgi:lysophospholipase L1-like esterase
MGRKLIALFCLVILGLLILYFVKILPETISSRVPGQQYVVSLGDSVAAGAGLPNNGNLGVNSCDLSEDAYPFVLAQRLDKQIEQVACSGATIRAGTNSLINQYNSAMSYISNSDVVIYAGANDIGWLQTLIGCAQTNCATNQNRNNIAIESKKLQNNLTTLLNKIHKLKPHRVIVNTYYSLLTSSNDCFSGKGITSQEVSFISSEESILNKAITASANNTKSTVVNINFSGHLLCDKNSWIQNLSNTAPIHPTAEGQNQIATQDAQAINSSD